MTTDMDHCFVCGKSPVQIHHCIYGTSGRKLSDSDGLFVPLCMDHHTGSKNGVHGQNYALAAALKMQAQKEYEKTHSRDDWMKRYGRNYL